MTQTGLVMWLKAQGAGRTAVRHTAYNFYLMPYALCLWPV